MGGCKLEADDGRYMKCNKCDQSYDLLCAGLALDRYQTLSIEDLNSWICMDCRSTIPKTGNTETPVRLFPSLSHCLGNDSSIAEIVDTSVLDLENGFENVTIGRGQYKSQNSQNIHRVDELPKCVCGGSTLRTIIREELKAFFTDRNPSWLLDAVLPKTSKLTQLMNEVLNTQAELLARLNDFTTLPSSVTPSSTCTKAQSANISTHLPPKPETPKLYLPISTTGNSVGRVNSPNKLTAPSPKQQQPVPDRAPPPVHTEPATKSQESRKVNLFNGDASENNSLGNTFAIADNASAWKNVQYRRGRMSNTPSDGVRDRNGTEGESGGGSHSGSDDRGHRRSSRVNGRTVGRAGAEGGVCRGTAPPGTTVLSAAERLQQLHLCYVQEGTTAEQVREHLNTICESDLCTVESLKPRGNYSSFKLGVPSKFSELVLSANNWAQGICVKYWRQNFRSGRGKSRVSGAPPA
ncbi:uncharacterized protein LOC134675641 [Cydia fagiglandana]|uniref:uncharacterized protein LOC134675641 n=1 Tax=Cydia fagiglandana TaxID=1458189 RepID=UPI002FEDEE2F